jgi:hypothetical protein
VDLLTSKYDFINLVNKWNNSAGLNTVVIIEMLTGYVSPFWFMNYSWVTLLAYVHAIFKAERKLQLSFGACERSDLAKSPTCQSNRNF